MGMCALLVAQAFWPARPYKTGQVRMPAHRMPGARLWRPAMVLLFLPFSQVLAMVSRLTHSMETELAHQGMVVS